MSVWNVVKLTDIKLTHNTMIPLFLMAFCISLFLLKRWTEAYIKKELTKIHSKLDDIEKMASLIRREEALFSVIDKADEACEAVEELIGELNLKTK